MDSDHNLIWSDRNSNHYFNNRWPIDAALKAATKDFVYASGQNQARIYLKEVPAEGQEGPALVHVFEVTRTRQNAVDIPKFKGKRTAWVGQAKKLSTERYLDKEAILSVIAPDQIPV